MDGEDPARRDVTLKDGRTLKADAILVATGSRAVMPDFPGHDLDGVFTLRSLDDAVRVSEAAGEAKTVVVVGAGIAGLAAAQELRGRGVDVQVWEARDRVGGFSAAAVRWTRPSRPPRRRHARSAEIRVRPRSASKG